MYLEEYCHFHYYNLIGWRFVFNHTNRGRLGLGTLVIGWGFKLQVQVVCILERNLVLPFICNVLYFYFLLIVVSAQKKKSVKSKGRRSNKKTCIHHTVLFEFQCLHGFGHKLLTHDMVYHFSIFV